jgi:hypothetical protein
MVLAGPTRIIDLLLDWVGPPVLIPMGLGGPSTINMQWYWVGPHVLLVCYWIGWAHQY